MDCSTFAFDLHVLGTPPALILSQDQTLKLNSFAFALRASAELAFRFATKPLQQNCLTQVSLFKLALSDLAYVK